MSTAMQRLNVVARQTTAPSSDKSWWTGNDVVKSQMYFRGPGMMVSSNHTTPEGFDRNLASGGIVLADADIHCCRGREHSLDREGFMLLPHESAVTDWNDREQLKTVYCAEMAEFAKNLLGADKAVAWHCIPRSTDESTGWRFTAGVIHNDFSDHLGPQMEDLVESGHASWFTSQGVSLEDLKTSRFQVLSFWRSVSPTPCERRPLAVLDASSVTRDDIMEYAYFPTTLKDGEYDVPRPNMMTQVRPGPHLRWGFYSKMTPGEVLVKKQYDSAGPAPYNGVGVHAAFDIPGDHEKPHRNSVELRVFCLTKY